MKLIYICSPYAGDIEANVEKARYYCREAVKLGFVPLAPHLLFPQFMDDSDPAQRRRGMTMGLHLLELCDEVWVCGLTGSEGMKREVMHAAKLRKTLVDFNPDHPDIPSGVVIEPEEGGQEPCIFTPQI